MLVFNAFRHVDLPNSFLHVLLHKYAVSTLDAHAEIPASSKQVASSIKREKKYQQKMSLLSKHKPRSHSSLPKVSSLRRTSTRVAAISSAVKENQIMENNLDSYASIANTTAAAADHATLSQRLNDAATPSSILLLESTGKQPPVKKKRIRAPVLTRPVCSFEGCNMSFSTRYVLVHSLIQSLTLATKISSSGHLARHVKIHTGVKTHSCPIEGCEKMFARKDNMMHHFNTHKRKLEAKDLHASKTGSFFSQDRPHQHLYTSPTTTLVSDDTVGSDPEKDFTSVTSGRTAASVSPSAQISFQQSGGGSSLKNASSASTVHPLYNSNSSIAQGDFLHQRRPKSAPLCSINTSSSFLNNGKPSFRNHLQPSFHFHSNRQFPPLSDQKTSSFVHDQEGGIPHSLLSAGAERLDFPFDLTQTFFDSPTMAPGYSSFSSSNPAPMSAPHTMAHMTFDQLYDLQRPSVSLQTTAFEVAPQKAEPFWSHGVCASDQLDKHFSSFFSGERKRSISIEGTSLVGNRSSSNAWSSFSLDL